jgi:hypothetical protein
MGTRKILITGLKILAVCVVFSVSFLIGGALSGLSNIAQQAPAPQTAQPVVPAQQAIPLREASPNRQSSKVADNFLSTFLIFSVCVGLVTSYLILRSSWQGWPLVAAMSVGIYGVSTVVAQVESLFFLWNKLPHGMIRAIFMQGAITTLLFAPLAVLLLGKWRAVSQAPAAPLANSMPASFWLWRLALIVVAFVFLYMFFGYYVAWQNPALRQYYGGPDYSSFYAALKANWMYHPRIYPLQVFRALLYAGCLYPLIRMLRATRWEAALMVTLFLSAWTTVLLLPNLMMPSSVARTHFWETLSFGLVFGPLAGWLLSAPPKQIAKLR